MYKLLLVRFRYCYCCVSVIICLSGYFITKSSFDPQSNLDFRPLFYLCKVNVYTSVMVYKSVFFSGLLHHSFAVMCQT